MTTENFVKNLKKILDERGISYAQAGRESGAGIDFIRNIERRGSAPSFVRVQQMAQYLGMTTSELLGEEEKPTPVLEDGLDDVALEKKFMSWFRVQPSDRQKEVLFELAKTVSENKK